MEASLHGHREVVEVLLGKGVSIDLQNKAGVTALMAASHACHAGHREVGEVVLRKRASPFAI